MATYTTVKNEEMWEVRDELGTVLDVFETRIAAREYIRELKQAKPNVTHMAGDYGYRDQVKETAKPIVQVETPMPIIQTVDYRPIVTVAVEKLVGIASRKSERPNSMAGQIRAYFKIAKTNSLPEDTVIQYLMETYKFNKTRAKSYVKCFWNDVVVD